MTDKAKKILALIAGPEEKSESDGRLQPGQPSRGSASSEKGMTILKDINEFEGEHEKIHGFVEGRG